MANMEPLEVMARLTCQALRVGHVVVVSLGVVPCGSPKTVMVKYGFGVCGTVDGSEIPNNRLLDV